MKRYPANFHFMCNLIWKHECLTMEIISVINAKKKKEGVYMSTCTKKIPVEVFVVHTYFPVDPLNGYPVQITPQIRNVISFQCNSNFNKIPSSWQKRLNSLVCLFISLGIFDVVQYSGFFLICSWVVCESRLLKLIQSKSTSHNKICIPHLLIFSSKM